MSTVKKIAMGACLLTSWMSAEQALAHGFSVGIRHWQASYELGQTDLGDEPLFIGYMGYHNTGWNVVAQAAHGDGWKVGEENLERFDLSLAVTKTQGAVTYGLGARRIAHELGDSIEEWSYYGPELLLGISLPLQDTGLALSLSGSFGLYWWDYENAAADNADGVTTGFSLDGGLSGRIGFMTLRGGYRFQQLSEDEDKNEGRTFYGEKFRGPYLEVGMAF